MGTNNVSPRSALTVPVEELTIHLIEDRRAVISPFGLGNSKLGERVYTFSRTAGSMYTCPGATLACEAVCYAKRMATPENGLELQFKANDLDGPHSSDLPADAEIVRIHVSGDFDTVKYINQWIHLANERPEVKFFGYTRSWRLPWLFNWLLRLRDLPNVQLFASVDDDHTDEEKHALVSNGWRLAWMGDSPDWATSIVCPEETGEKASCEKCRYCFIGQRGDVSFPIH